VAWKGGKSAQKREESRRGFVNSGAKKKKEENEHKGLLGPSKEKKNNKKKQDGGTYYDVVFGVKEEPERKTIMGENRVVLFQGAAGFVMPSTPRGSCPEAIVKEIGKKRSKRMEKKNLTRKKTAKKGGEGGQHSQW